MIDTTENLEEFLTTKLSSKLWRLDNLYKIRDKAGNLVILKLNESQRRVLTDYKHNKKIILKSRQQGISTLAVAYNLDACLFHEGFATGIQSYGQDESKKLQRKAELMWYELDPNIKKLLNISLTMNNANGMAFSNGSILKIGNFRGDTLQSLHVSELAKIAKKFPEKANELKTGAFQAIAKNSKITIESTAEGRFGLFYDMWNKAELHKNIGKTLTPFDFQPIFLSWIVDPDCNMDEDIDFDPYILEYFDMLKNEHDIELTPTQKKWYQAKYNEIGIMIKQEYPTIPKEAFEKSLEGTYYEHEYKQLKLTKELKPSHLLVHSAVDLGMNDTFSIGFFVILDDGTPFIIDEYHDSGHGLAFYKDVYDAFAVKYNWDYGITFVPHDINVKELTSDKTRLEVMRELGFNPIVIKKHALQDGIEVTRQFLRKCKIHEKCEHIIASIQGYRKAWNQQLGVFLDKPVHDELSHAADMIRYMAMGLKYYRPYNNAFKRYTPQYDEEMQYWDQTDSFCV